MAQDSRAQDNRELIAENNGLFHPTEAFSGKAFNASMDDYQNRYASSIEDPEAFWAEVAESFHWFDWTTNLFQSSVPLALRAGTPAASLIQLISKGCGWIAL